MPPLLSLRFSEVPPGLNGKDGLLRIHWTERQALMFYWRMLVGVALPERFSTINFPVVVRATRYGRHPMDWDNFGASLKPILDALVHWEIIADDSPAHVARLELSQAKSKEKSLTVELFTL